MSMDATFCFSKKEHLPIFNFQISKILLSQIFLPKTSFNEINKSDFWRKSFSFQSRRLQKYPSTDFCDSAERIQRIERIFDGFPFAIRRKVMRCKHHFSKAGKKLQNLSKASIGYSTLMRVVNFFRSQEMLASYFLNNFILGLRVCGVRAQHSTA